MKKIKEIIHKIAQEIRKAITSIPLSASDISILLGALWIILPTFLLNTIAGMYVLGVFFLLIGIYFIFVPPHQDKRR